MNGDNGRMTHRRGRMQKYVGGMGSRWWAYNCILLHAMTVSFVFSFARVSSSGQ